VHLSTCNSAIVSCKGTLRGYDNKNKFLFFSSIYSRIADCKLLNTVNQRLQALGASVATLAKAQRASKAGVMLMDAAASGGSDAVKAAAISQLASGKHYLK
jgi:hypothetical protein